VLHEPTTPTMAPPAAVPDVLPESVTALEGSPIVPSPPSDLRPLAQRARRDTVAARELATTLLGRGWSVRRTAALAGLAEATVTALSHVRRPATAARAVAEDVAARARRRVAAGRRA
jgi:hypothetical protein